MWRLRIRTVLCEMDLLDQEEMRLYLLKEIQKQLKIEGRICLEVEDKMDKRLLKMLEKEFDIDE